MTKDFICESCIHFDRCKGLYRSERLQKIASKGCPYFKDRSHFVELQQAEWIEKIDNYGEPFYRCSECNEEFVLEEGTPEENNYFFCPYCGAEMKFCGLKRSRTGVEIKGA